MASAKQKTRVVILTGAGERIGGIYLIVVNLTRKLRQQGHHTRCAFPHMMNAGSLLAWCQQQGVDAETTAGFLNQTDVHTLATTLHLRQVLFAWKPTAVSLHYPDFLPLKDLLAVRLAGVRRCVATIHNVTDWSPKRRTTGRLAAMLVDSIIVHSHQAGKALIEAGIPTRKITYFPPGLRLPEYVPTRASARIRLGLPAEAFIVGTHARLVVEKGVRDLIEVVGHLPAKVDGPYLLIAGDGPERDELAALAATKLGSRVRLLGQIGGEELAEFYAALDVFALAPHIREAFGLVYIEAAQFGVPSVSWRIGGVAEAVLDGETGLLVGVHDLVGLEQAIARLRTDPSLRAQLGARAQIRASSEFTETRMAEEYARLLHLPQSALLPRDGSLVTEPQPQ